ncbi:MAG TPA: hypothetical protein VLI46_12440 [Ramlibacter sp.]|nr:hypothetical protein [Ramlibacter sp.]
MLRILAVALVCVVVLGACSPTFNWREARAGSTGLKAMLPCKPDKGARTVPMAGREVSLEVMGCDTGGATFAVMFADIGDAARAGEVLALWKTATLANLRSKAGAQESTFHAPGAQPLAQSVQVVATGQRADGSQVESHAAYFARGSHVFQAVIYTDHLKAEVAEPFFSGLRFE